MDDSSYLKEAIARASNHFSAIRNTADKRIADESLSSNLVHLALQSDETTQLFLTTLTTREYKIKVLILRR